MCQPIAGRGFEHIHAVDVEVLLSRMRGDFQEAIAQYANQGSDQKYIG